MKTRFVTSVSLVVALMAVTFLMAAEEINLKGIKCVMNPKAAAKADKVLDHKGGQVYFCCGNCPKAFTSKIGEDEIVQARANHQLVATKQAVQGKCPFSGQPLNTETAIKVNGASIAFCCNNCKGNAEKLAGNAQLKKLFSDAAFKKAGFKVAAAE